ncbi:hypothetical protein QFC19_006189 [Naganishia cerealis]|uniref:Uncharacterized protein n=1 Tax=Naganishia cerealis TaxID=610337 RepID=A0ACC2VHT8_9TREE|nr:hypothetical protein QFC19_006189 [Naganishia cerealis]
MNQLWALLLALLAVSSPTIVIASATSTSNLSMAAGPDLNLDVGAVPPRHQRMEKRFVGSMRSDPAMRRKVSRGDRDTVHVGRGGKFDLVKKQQQEAGVTVAATVDGLFSGTGEEAAAVVAQENTFDAVQLAALIESIVAGNPGTSSAISSTSTRSSITTDPAQSTSTATITATTMAPTPLQIYTQEVTTSSQDSTIPFSLAATSTSTSDTGVSSTSSSRQMIAETRTHTLIETQISELETIWRLVNPWRPHRQWRRGTVEGGALKETQVKVPDEQNGANITQNIAELSVGTVLPLASESTGVKDPGIPLLEPPATAIGVEESSTSMEAEASSMFSTSALVVGSADFRDLPTSAVPVSRSVAPLTTSGVYLSSTPIETAPSMTDSSLQETGAGEARLSNQSGTVVANDSTAVPEGSGLPQTDAQAVSSGGAPALDETTPNGTTEVPQSIGIGRTNPKTMFSGAGGTENMTTQMPATETQQNGLAGLASTSTGDAWYIGTRAAATFNASSLPDVVLATSTVTRSVTTFPPVVNSAFGNASQYSPGIGFPGNTRVTGNSTSGRETGVMTGRIDPTSGIFTYNGSSFLSPPVLQTPVTTPLSSGIPSISPSRNRNGFSSNHSAYTGHSLRNSKNDTASSTILPVILSTSLLEATATASSAAVDETPSVVSSTQLAPTQVQATTGSSSIVESSVSSTAILSDTATVSETSSAVAKESESSAPVPTSSAQPTPTTIFSEVISEGVTSTVNSESDVAATSTASDTTVLESSTIAPLPTAGISATSSSDPILTSTSDGYILPSDTVTDTQPTATFSSEIASSTILDDPASATQSPSSAAESSTKTFASVQPTTTATDSVVSSLEETVTSSSTFSTVFVSESATFSSIFVSESSTSADLSQPTESQSSSTSSVESSRSSEPTASTGISSASSSMADNDTTTTETLSSSAPLPTSSPTSTATDFLQTSPSPSPSSSSSALNSVTSDETPSTVTPTSTVATATTSSNVSAEPTSSGVSSNNTEPNQTSTTWSSQSTQATATETSTDTSVLESGSVTSSDVPVPTGQGNETVSQTGSDIPVSVTTTTSDIAEPTQSISGNETASAIGNATFTGTASLPLVTASASDTSSFEWASSSDTSYSPTAAITSDEPYVPSQTYLIYATPTSSASSWSEDEASWATESATTTTSQSAVIMPSTATIPSNVPTIIVPYNSPAATAASGESKGSSDSTGAASLISILLNANNYPWDFVVGNSDATSQLFINFPLMIANALGIDQSNVTTYALQAYSPAAVQGESTSVLTRWIGYIPTARVSDLSAYIKTPSSPLYRQAGITGQLAAQIDSSYPLTGSSTSGSTSSAAASAESESKSNSHRDIIIGVCVGVGGALWVALVFWIYRRVKRNHDARVHKRLSEHGSFLGSGMAGGYIPEGRHSRTSSLAASEIDNRPSSFYADPTENEPRNRRQSHATIQTNTWNARLSSQEQSRQDRLSTSFSSWFRSSGSHSHSNRHSHGEGFSSAPQMSQLQNPFADTAHRSYLDRGPSRGASTWRRSHTPKPISKNQIGQPTLQANSLEFTEQR